ncbi:MAG: MFS transporter [Rhodobacterales bacterium]|nr:MFS transporter [Rhodobacterales bacterium]
MLADLLPIAILLVIIMVIVLRMPKIDLGFDAKFRARRMWNWFPLGMTYAFLYMGRYNLAAAKDIGAISQTQYGDIFAVGAGVYGLSFLLNGPLADRYGGRVTILAAAIGSAFANIAMGFAMSMLADDPSMPTVMAVLYGINMYFQSFGAVSVVKVNASWFHIQERGVYGGMFGIMISLGILFAFDWGHKIAKAFPIEWLFWIPAIILLVFFAIDYVIVQSTPVGAGFDNFDTGDATGDDDRPPDPALQVMLKMVKNPVILTIAAIEFCSGFLRNAIMHWYRDFAKGMQIADSFVYENWGMLLCVAGITGGMFAGIISDRIFNARRGPVAAVLYGVMVVGGIVLIPTLGIPMAVGAVVIVMSMAIIGVHGMLSGTASADFGGKRNAGIAVGLIDAAVYAGTMTQSLILGRILPAKGTPEAGDIEAWVVWPYAMIPVAIIGMLLSISVWNAKPKAKEKTPEADEAPAG